MYPYLLMILVVIFYAGNILTGKALNNLPPFTIAFFRLLVAFFVLVPLGFRSAWQARDTFLEHKKPFMIMTLTGVTFFNTFIYSSLQFTTATNVSVLEAVIPVVTVILSAWLLKERLVTLQWIGVLLSFIGAIWVVLDGGIFQLTLIDWNIGDAIMIGAIFAWAIYSISVNKYMYLFPAYGAVFAMTGISVLILFPIVLLEWMIVGVPSIFSLQNISGFLYLGIFPSFFALIFFNRAVESLGASKSSIFLNFLPVFTIAGAYLWLGETISSMQIIGSFVVVLGVILTTQIRSSNREQDRGSERTG